MGDAGLEMRELPGYEIETQELAGDVAHVATGRRPMASSGNGAGPYSVRNDGTGAVVYDSDVSTNHEPLEGNQGATLLAAAGATFESSEKTSR